MSRHDWSWQGHVRFPGAPLGLCSQFGCCASQLFFFFFFFGKLIQGLSLASSWVIMPQRLPGGSAWQTLTHWMVGQTNRLPQTAATTILSNQRPGNQVQKGIRGDYLGHPGFFTIGGDVERSCTLCAERLPSVAACSAAPCCGKGRKEEQGPKQIMLSSAWMPSNHSSPLPLCRNPPPPAGPSLQSQLRACIAQRLFETQGTATSCPRPLPGA